MSGLVEEVPEEQAVDSRGAARGACEPRGGRAVGLRWSLALPSLVVILAAIAFVLPQALAFGHDPLAQQLVARFRPPSADHWFGTDSLGRDVYARTVYGLRPTVLAGLVATAISLVAGIGIGLLSGLVRSRLALTLLSRFIDVLSSIPGIVIVLLLVTALTRSTLLVAIGTGLIVIPRFARLTKTEVLRTRSKDFVTNSRLSGSSHAFTVFRHILPNVLPQVLAIVVIEFSGIVILVSSFNFLGLGDAGPAPELGLLISEGQPYLRQAWWISTAPGLVLLLLVLSINSIWRLAGQRRRRR